MVLLGIVAFTALVVVVVLIAGPKACRSPSARSSPTTASGCCWSPSGWGSTSASVTLNQACVAQGQVRRAAVRWITCAALFIGWNFVPLVSNE